MSLPVRAAFALLLVSGASASIACTPSEKKESEQTLTVFAAAALGPPLRESLQSFAKGRAGVVPQLENAPSLEVVRKVTELGSIPDVLAVADHSLIPLLLMPSHATWYALFGTNAIVLAYGPKARHSEEINSENWWKVLTRPGVQVGRSDLRVDPSGYRADMVMQLAESFYQEPGLTARLRAALPERNVRRAEADLTALLQVGELDYGWTYENLARAHGLKYVKLPADIDLSDPARADTYAKAVVTLPSMPGETPLVMRGAPIVFALTIPTKAPHPALAREFLKFLFSSEGATVLRKSGFTPLPKPEFRGDVPSAISELSP